MLMLSLLNLNTKKIKNQNTNLTNKVSKSIKIFCMNSINSILQIHIPLFGYK